jgi:hypothetical protein
MKESANKAGQAKMFHPGSANRELPGLGGARHDVERCFPELAKSF